VDADGGEQAAPRHRLDREGEQVNPKVRWCLILL
jgi:hypothetical protein